MYKAPLESEHIYHIYNRGIDGQRIFFHLDHYTFFLKKYAQYVSPVAETSAYCMLSNHFHFLVRIKAEEVRTQLREKPVAGKTHIILNPSRQFGHLFNCYAQMINRRLNRTGALFEEAFERKKIDSDVYLTNVIDYIHKNPQKHKIDDDFENYPYSSYQSLISLKSSRLAREEVLSWFGGREKFKQFHTQNHEQNLIEKYIFV